MRFYIFGFNHDSDAIFSIDKAILNDDNYQYVRKYYDIVIKEYRYKNIYLVADLNIMEAFEDDKKVKDKPVSLTKSSILENDYIPYLIIGEFHYNFKSGATPEFENEYFTDGELDPNRTIRRDTIFIKATGFVHKFLDTEQALISYINNINSHTRSQLYLKLKIDNSIRKDIIMDRLVGDSVLSTKKLKEGSFKSILLPKSIPYSVANFKWGAATVFDLKANNPDYKPVTKDKQDLEIIPITT